MMLICDLQILILLKNKNVANKELCLKTTYNFKDKIFKPKLYNYDKK